MANRHFGKIGDIWKHLPLAEILSIEKPKQYWETNAGSAQYPLTHSIERDYGVYYFYEYSAGSSALLSSNYFQILDGLKKEDRFPLNYPGSPYISMSLLRPYAKQFIFCDIDAASLENIRESASELEIPENKVRCVNADGVRTLLEQAAHVPKERASEIFIQCDPCGGFVGDTYLFDDPFQEGERNRPSPLEFFFKMSGSGFKVMFWYGFQSYRDRSNCHQQIKLFRDKYELNGKDKNLWCGEICLSIIDNQDFKLDPGVKGCGVLLGNLTGNALTVCSLLGVELVKIYESASFPDGSSGATDFAEIKF
jgi:23S rRNA (adenine2030-N6)-methyltransferase